MFATAFYMIADPETGQIEYANAGHPSPLHVQQDTCVVTTLQTAGPAREPALGLLDYFEYPTYQGRLQNGDLIMLYTDGLFDVDGPSDEEFGQERLLDAVHKRIMLPPLLLFDELLTEIQQFSATHEFGDDVCLVGMQITRGGKAAARNGHAP
jgi:sigma-B regulation protein RsbU (phosphoserine phosphatase)